LRRVPAAHGEGVRGLSGLRRVPRGDGTAARRAAPPVIDDAALARQSLPALLLDRARRTPGRVAYRAKTLGVYRETTWSELADRVHLGQDGRPEGRRLPPRPTRRRRSQHARPLSAAGPG